MSGGDSRKTEVAPLGPPNPNNRWDVLRWATMRMEGQRISARERLREEMKAASIPLPAQIVMQLAQLRSVDLHEVLIDHPGFTSWNRYTSYEVSLRVFDRAVLDLVKAIQRFEAATEADSERDILSRTQRSVLRDIERTIEKELFAATNAAHSLVDHSTRRLQSLVEITGYPTKLTECFGEDGLHEFVIGLRNILHHLHMIKPGWSLEHDFRSGTKKAMFTLDRIEVRFAVEQSRRSFGGGLARIQSYLHASSEPINLKTMFEEYQRRVTKFHVWYGNELASERLTAIRDYERCLRENKNFAACTFWRAMLGNWLRWKVPPNPYDHLLRYLTPEQLAEIYRSPMQSEEQVDKVIEFVDLDRACDREVRKMAYELFRRATPPRQSDYPG